MNALKRLNPFAIYRRYQRMGRAHRRTLRINLGLALFALLPLTACILMICDLVTDGHYFRPFVLGITFSCTWAVLVVRLMVKVDDHDPDPPVPE